MRISVKSKWWLVAGYWLAQGAAVYLVTPAWMISASNVDYGAGNWGTVSWSEYRQALTETWWLVWTAIIVSGLTVAQLIFVWPVRKPVPSRQRGWPIWVSLGVAGLGIATLATGLVLGVSQWIYTMTGFDPFTQDMIPIDPAWVVLAWCLVSWGVATPLLIRFCRRGPRESLLARVSSRLFLGTVIEVAAMIPLDVMVRRRESCYCWSGTYFGLTLCAAVGLFILGPAVFLPLLVRRRRRWHEGRCEACGYDMSATPRAERCPECGVGWKEKAQGEGTRALRHTGTKG